MSSLSQRGALAANSPLRVDFEIFNEAMENRYHPTDNPEGALPLNVAENKLSWPLLHARIREVMQGEVPAWVPYYTSCLGSPVFRESMAGFMSRFLTHCPIEPTQLGIAVGATAIVELTSWILGNPGDVAVFPGPAYPTYKQDVENKAGLERYNLITHQSASEIGTELPLEIAHLEKAKAEIEAQGKRFRMLVLTSPDNPTGGIYSFEKLQAIADWCVQRQIHLIVNEIYGLSLINTEDPDLKADYPETIPYRSFAQIMAAQQSEYLHLWYALSKDLGISGFRVGVLHSWNLTLLQAFDNLGAPHLVSNLTQWVLAEVLADHDFIENYIQHNQAQLTKAYKLVIQVLRKLNIGYTAARGSLFAWLDLSRFLAEQTQEAENVFWETLYRKTGVLLTPGEGFGHQGFGYFRLVYPCVSMEELALAMQRMESYLSNIKA